MGLAGWRGRALGPLQPGRWGTLTFSLETWWEKGQVPSVFLQVPRTNLRTQGRSGGAGAQGGPGPSPPHAHLGVGAHLALAKPPSSDRGRRGSVAAVAPAKAVVVHAVPSSARALPRGRTMARLRCTARLRQGENREPQ